MPIIEDILDGLTRKLEFVIQKLSGPPLDRPPSSSSLPPAKLYLHAQVNAWFAENDDGEEDEVTERSEMVPNPTPDDVRSKADSIDWTDAAFRSYLALGPGSDRRILNVSMKGTLGKPNVDGLLRVHAMLHRDDEVVLVRSPPLNNVDEGIDLLNMLLSNEPGLLELVDTWAPYAPEENDE